MSENRTVYQLRCTGSQDMWNRKHSIYSQTVYLDRQAAEADAAAFHAKCTRSEGVSSMFDLDPDAIVTVVELTLVTPSPPRRTLADLVANPPQGWETNLVEGGAQFVRRNASGHILAIFGWANGKVINDWVAVAHPGQRQPMTPAERAAIHRDTTNLLTQLAEVSDG